MPDGGRLIRLYFAVVFWGEEYRRYFLDYCLASLMASGNFPAITDKANARLLIATPDADWQAMQAEPIFQAAQQVIAIEQLPFEVPDAVPREEKMAMASRAHKALAQRMFEDGAHGCFLYPDIVIAINFVRKLDELARRGIKAVLYMNMRFANERTLDALHVSGVVRSGQPLEVAPEALVRMIVANMHSEMARTEFDGVANDYGAHSFFWRVSGDNLVYHFGSWAPVLIDYGSIKQHDASTFDTWTIDGDYVAKNFPNPDDVYASMHSDEMFFTSFTPESQVHYSLAPYPPYRWRWLRELLKTYMAHNYLYGHVLDPVKKRLIRRPVRLRGGEASEAEWRAVEARAAAVIRRIERTSPSLADQILTLLLDGLRGLMRARRLLMRA